MLMRKQKKISLVLQSEIAECGLACLTMILSFYKHCISLTELRNIILR
jgi:ATP-binding cassette subfamily B protein RaxB